MAGVTLVFSPIVHAVRNNVPTHVPVRHLSLEKWTARSQRQENGADHIQLIIDIPRMIVALGREGTLQAAGAHPKGHGVHVDVSFLRFSFINFGKLRILIHEDRHVDFNSSPSAEPYIFGQVGESWMVGDVVVIDVGALRDSVVETRFGGGVADTHEGDDGDRHGEAGFVMKNLVLVPDGGDDVVEVATGVVRFTRNHFEHPGTVLEHQREVQVLILLRNVLLAEVQLPLLVYFQEMALYFLTPLDVLNSLRLGPSSIGAEPVQKLAKPNDFQDFLHFHSFLEVLNRSQV